MFRDPPQRNLGCLRRCGAAGGLAKGDLADHAEAERMLRDFVRWRRGMPKGGEPVPFVSKDPFGECNTAAQVLVDDAPFISQAVACDGRTFGYCSRRQPSG